MKCKKHVWEWLYHPTDQTDKIGFAVENLRSGGRMMREVYCQQCGALGYKRASNRNNFTVYAWQWKHALEAVERITRLQMAFPQAAN